MAELSQLYLTVGHRLQIFLMQQLVAWLLHWARLIELKLGMTVAVDTTNEPLALSSSPSRSYNFAQELRWALDSEQFTLDYQPQVDLESGQLLGLECLIRWHHPHFGQVSPADFIPIAEETGLIIPLGNWILREACRQYQHWQASGLPPFKLSVNLSIRQLQEPNLVEQIRLILSETAMNPANLELEITESFMMTDTETALEALMQLKQLGLQIAIDDFGTGYSSLATLKNLPVQTLKIDKSFLDDLAVTNKNWVILQSIIDLGHRLKLTIIAEGVESLEQMTILKIMNCDSGQGYFISRPLNLEGINHYLGCFLADPNFQQKMLIPSYR
jgi:EAL domain-containing protein (putative c-di-GMP-specific phosphodiesterase class I)